MSLSGNRFDQFGNLIGEESDDDDVPNQAPEASPENGQTAEIQHPVVLLPEDKEFYPLPNEVYPQYTTVKHEDEDRQDFTEPLLKPPVHRVIAQDLKTPPPTTFSHEFLLSLLKYPQTTRNIAFVGSLGHGKTEFIDALVRETHPGILETCLTNRDITNVVVGEGRRLDHLGYTDRLFLEKRRKLSVSTEVVTLVDQTLYGKSLALNLIDTPGHPDFIGEVKAGLALCDGVAFCVDCVEGLTQVGMRLLKTVAYSGLPVLLVLTKIDRLILEMKLPPTFAKDKLRHVIEQVNTCLHHCGRTVDQRLSPEKRNVIFSAAQFSLCFSTESIAQMYNRKPDRTRAFNASCEGSLAAGGRREDAIDLAARLWEGYRMRGREIFASAQDLPQPFVALALEPLYKVITHVLSMEPWEWSKKLQIPLSNSELSMNSAPLLRIALSRVFGSFGPFVLACEDFLPPPVDRTIAGSEANIVAYASKFNPATDGQSLYTYARIYRGELHPHDRLFALLDSYRDNENDKQQVELQRLSISGCRYEKPLEAAGPGMIVRLSATSPELVGVCTLTDEERCQLAEGLSLEQPLLKVAIEPLDPLKKKEMVDAMDRARLCYSSLVVCAHGNGEHNLIGTGELFLDCVLHDIRNTYCDLEVKVSDPFVVFNESVGITSTQIIEAEFGAKSIGLIAQPVPDPVQTDIDIGRLSHAEDVSTMLQSDGVDEMMADGFWALGPDATYGPNMLVEDTLPPKDSVLTEGPMRSLIEGAFNWATKSGPLCDEAMRGVLYRIVKSDLGGSMEGITPVKVIPTVLKGLYGAFLAAKPILLEPVYTVEVLVPQETAQIIIEIIEKRRGEIIKTLHGPVEGTMFRRVVGKVPLIDSFGMEVDMRMRTLGKAFPLSFFSGWKKVTGDPLDTQIKLRPLEIATKAALAREFVVKSRRRRGLPDDVDMSKYLTEAQLIEMASLIKPAPEIDD